MDPATVIDTRNESTFFYQGMVYTPDQSIGFLMRRVLSSSCNWQMPSWPSKA